MNSNNDKTVVHESTAPSNGQQNDYGLQSERIKKLEDNFGLMCNYVKRNNRRIHSLFLKVTPESELLSGLLTEEERNHLPGTDGDGNAFDSFADDSSFLDIITAQSQIDDNYKKLERSLEEIHKEMKEKDQQHKSMREELDKISRTTNQQQAHLPGTYGDGTESNNSIAKDSKFRNQITTKNQVDDNYKKLENSLKQLHQENKEKDEQLESMRKELDAISKTTSQQQGQTWSKELGESSDNTGIKSESKIFSRNRNVDPVYNFESCDVSCDDERNEKAIHKSNRQVSDIIGENSEFLNRDLESSREVDAFREINVFDETRISMRTAFLMHNKQELEHHHLPMDTYSYLAVADYFKGCVPTYAFCTAMFVLSVQLTTLVIFELDVMNGSHADNPMSIPAGVGGQVRASQVIALIISCWNQGEIADSFNIFSIGYNEDRIRAISHSATRSKWYFSAVLRIIIGLFSLLVTFTLVVNSETVKDVMLDFVAVTFVTHLDHANFRLSLWGYFGKSVQHFAVKIKIMPICDCYPTMRLMKVPRLAWMLIIFGAFMVPWAIITAKQERGEFMDRTIFVQFGDEFSPSIGAFSGLYRIGLDNSLDGIRVNYVEQQSQRQRATFSYCTQECTWIFQYGTNPEQRYSDDSGYSGCWSRARSSQTMNLDITRTSQYTWFVNDEHMMLEMPLQHMYVSGRSSYYGEYCENGNDCGERMYCEEDTGECVCNDGLFGLNCEFPEPCQTLEIDTRDPNGGFYGTRSWSKRYSIIQEDEKKGPFQVYGKPVYLGIDSTEGFFEVMIFIGRRWILTDSESIKDYHLSSAIPVFARNLAARDFVEFLASDFHAYWSNYTFYFASEPVDVGTPTDSATPADLQWYRMKTSGMQGVSLRSREKIWQQTTIVECNLFCAVCNNNTNPCFYGAVCRSDGTCHCNTGSSGRLCQVPPSGNGMCDEYFNTPEFGFDGGDCCEETCTSTEENTCGRGMIENSAGLSAYGFIGYPNCRDPRYSSKLSGSVTLYDVIERGTVRCGSQQFPGFLNITDGVYTGFEADLCRAIAAAALGDPEAMEIIETTPVDRFSDLSEGKFDVLLSATTFTAERDIYQSDSRMGFSFAPTPYFFDGLYYGGIPPFTACADNLDVVSPDCSNLRICVLESSSWLQVTERLFPSQVIVKVETRQKEVNGLQSGLCNVIAGEITLAAEFVVRKMGFTGHTYELSKNVFSKEPLAAVTRQDDRVWSKFVSWIFEALIQAEESNVTRLTANKLSTSDVFGEQFQNMFGNAVAANGNYGEIYQKNLEEEFPRGGLNRINMGSSGLIYSFPFGSYENSGPGPIVGGSIEAIRRRGVLNCGIVPTPGFAVLDHNTLTWHGIDVDMCKGIAAALLSGYPHVTFIPLAPNERFRALVEGAVDVVGWSVHTLTREVKESTTGEGFDFTPPYFYDGLGFGGLPTFAHCAEELALGNLELTSKCTDTRICVPSETTWLEAMLNQLNIPAENILVTESLDSLYEEFILGNCNVVAGESAQTAEFTVREKGYLSSKDYVIRKRKYTKEHAAFMSRSTDTQFSDFLKWIVFGFFFAAENGVTREKYVNMPITFLFGDSLSLMWQNAIQAVGNYNELLERNFAGVMEVGVQNDLNNRNGPQFFAKPGVMIN